MKHEICREVSTTVDGLHISVKRDAGGAIRALEVRFGPAAPLKARGSMCTGQEGAPSRHALPGADDDRGFDSFITAWRSPRGRLRRLWRTCSSAQLHAVYAAHCSAQGIGDPLRREEFGARLKGVSNLRLGRGAIRDESGQRKQLRCVFIDSQAGPPDQPQLLAADWLRACIEAFDSEVARLRRSGVLPMVPPACSIKPRKVTR